MTARRSRARGAVELLVLDVDGVLTDGRLYFGPDGEALKLFHVRDGLGIKLLQRAGIRVAVVSGRSSPAVATRCRELGISAVLQGCDDKVAAVAALAREFNVPLKNVACVIDDTSDLPLAKSVGTAIAVADAHADVKRALRHVTTLPGGHGAVREVCDRLLKSAGRGAKA
ncbi:MAG: KdsC family phosphatase [Steroidobacteraceae bacterium]